MNPILLRNRTIRAAREFFATQKILEVATPKAVLSPALEPYIDALKISAEHSKDNLYLVTSPEFSLKKIFSAEMTAHADARGIYEITPVFRDDPPGKNHALEFTMIEWYERSSTLTQILDTAAKLILNLSTILGSPLAEKNLEILDLQELFATVNCSFNFADEESSVKKYQSIYGHLPSCLNATDAAIVCFNLLFDEYVLPVLREKNHLVAVRGYPDYLGALAYSENGVAERAEIFYRGLELANGYREEFRPDVARKRWEKYNVIRNLRNVAPHDIDQLLLTRLPDMKTVSGIALGLERILLRFFPELKIKDLS